jgi:hypothetical protein
MYGVTTQAAQNHLGVKRELLEGRFEFLCRCIELLGAFAKRLQGVR